MIKGYWIPVLHSHLPFVKHPEYDYFLEEHWLFEALSESYIPLLMKMEKMVSEDIDFRLAISMTPPLLEMLSDEYLTGQYEKHLDKLIILSEMESKRLKKDRDFFPLARFYHKKFKEIKSFFNNFLKNNVLNGYRYFSDLGKLEIITSCATHGFLPLLRANHKSVDVQISVAVDSFNKHFGRSPDGIWLPECAYYENLDEVLRKYDLKYFFLDSQGLMDGKPVPRYSIYAPVYTKTGVAAFARDPKTSKQVWSGDVGYPGDSRYRDFYRDIGFDLDFNYIKPYISPDGVRVFTGIKYYKITGKTDYKEPYKPEEAAEKNVEHALHFCSERGKQIEALNSLMDRPPVLVSPYDAELFGHWWFEGPDFLYHVFREIEKNKVISAITPSEYLSMFPQNQVISPSPTSWGYRGYYDVWLNGENDWVYRHLHYMADTLENLANKHFNETDKVKNRLLNQLTRELLLAQSSDWAFLMTTNTAREYSTRRTKEHIANFNGLLDNFLSDSIDVSRLEWMEYKNSIFKELDFRVFAGK
jgi:1,4-alpha-glucan branching enzyme